MSSASGPAHQWTPLSSRPCLPLGWRCCKWQGPFAPRTLLRLIATTDPAATLSSSADFPVAPVITAYLAPAISRRDEEGFSSCSACPCHPCRRFHPAEVNSRISQCSAAHAAFALLWRDNQDEDVASIRMRMPPGS